MRCVDYEQLLESWLDGDLSPAEHARCRRHLAGCADCRELVEPLTLAATDVPPAFLEAVLATTSGAVCGHAEQRLVALVDGALDAAAADLTVAHITACADCSRLVESLHYLDTGLPQLAEVDPGSAFTARVLAACRPRPSLAERWRRAWHGTWATWMHRPRFAFEAAYILLLVCILLFNAVGSPLAALPVRALGAATGPRPWVDEMTAAVEKRSRSLLGQVAATQPVRSLSDSGDTLGQLARQLTQELRTTGGTLVEGFASLLETDEGGNEHSPTEPPPRSIDTDGPTAEETP